MPRGPTLRQADVERVIRALAAHGLAPSRIEIAPGGGVVIIPRPAAADAAPLTPPLDGVSVTSLDLWRAKKRGAGAN
jgi:hypothetical protein